MVTDRDGGDPALAVNGHIGLHLAAVALGHHLIPGALLHGSGGGHTLKKLAMNGQIGHPLEIAHKGDGGAGDGVPLLNGLGLLVDGAEHLIHIFQGHVVGEDVVHNGVDLFAVAAASVEAGKGDPVAASLESPVLVKPADGQQLGDRSLGGEGDVRLAGQILIDHQSLLHIQHFAGVGGDGQIGEGGILCQVLQCGVDHKLAQIKLFLIAVDIQVLQLPAPFGLGDGGVADIHHVAHDVLLGVLPLQTLVADDIKIQGLDDAVLGGALKDKGIILGLAGGGGAGHLILGGKVLHHRAGIRSGGRLAGAGTGAQQGQRKAQQSSGANGLFHVHFLILSLE